MGAIIPLEMLGIDEGDDELVEIDEMLVMLVVIRGDEFDDYDYVLV
jgi:hypothetical protein